MVWVVFENVSLESIPCSEGRLATLTAVRPFPGVQEHVAHQ